MHVDVQYDFVRDMVKNQKVLLEKVETLKNFVDSLSKSVSTKKFSWCREGIGLATLLKWTKLLNLLFMQIIKQVGGHCAVLYYLHDTDGLVYGQMG